MHRYLSAHILYEWARDTSHKKATNPNPYDFEHYSLEFTLTAVTLVRSSEAFKDIA